MISEKKCLKVAQFSTQSKRWSLKSLRKWSFDFLKSNFGGIKVKPTVVEREYTPGIN